MGKLIDYAGLFPPTQLPLEKAIENYASYVSGSDKWMLSAFVSPVSTLDALDPYVSLFSYENPLLLSVLGRNGNNLKESLTFLKEDIEKVEKYRGKFPGIVQINYFEFPLPTVDLTSDYLNFVAESVKDAGLTCYCEVSVNELDASWDMNLNQTLQQIANHNEDSFTKIGVKLRTGGIHADLIPSIEVVANYIHKIKNFKLPTKFTAGLHHPIRMFRKEVQAEMHGFVNVFIAGLMAHTQDLSIQEIAEILEDKNGLNFTFTENTLKWGKFTVLKREIKELREKYLHSYGSCSFEVPLKEFKKQVSIKV